VDVHRGKDFEGEDEKRFSPAYSHGYILLIRPYPRQELGRPRQQRQLGLHCLRQLLDRGVDPLSIPCSSEIVESCPRVPCFPRTPPQGSRAIRCAPRRVPVHPAERNRTCYPRRKEGRLWERGTVGGSPLRVCPAGKVTPGLLTPARAAPAALPGGGVRLSVRRPLS
jgi:hypothetical protein